LGSGSEALDTNLYRESSDVLKTDDTFKSSSLFVNNVEISTVGAENGEMLVFDGEKFGSSTLPTNEPKGISVRLDSAISFDDSTRTFSIAPSFNLV
jgi:hypothetical protein